ncbi:MAG: bifunctional hydroxymethylpyrimidine kinase/phosphomethylpyrimidine kinase, partial [Methylobacterium sp.]|nr:bifunctional hydroxymethylpyrimidine kinase/phosphomethylpyrimidine kinase [Methylobacterium sp.]
TPNLAEAAALTHAPIAQDLDAMQRQGEAIRAMGARSVLMKGGHAEGAEAIDLLVSDEGSRVFSAPRIETRHTHGTGCTLSAAIAAGLARGQPMEEAIGEAKAYLTAALVAGRELGLGHGNGPVHHFHALRAR